MAIEGLADGGLRGRIADVGEQFVAGGFEIGRPALGALRRIAAEREDAVDRIALRLGEADELGAVALAAGEGRLDGEAGGRGGRRLAGDRRGGESEARAD